MRWSFLILAVGMTASPALAQDRTAPPPVPTASDLAHLSDTLSNPAVQGTVAAVVDQFAAALLATRVGPLARYADPRDHVRAEDTLGDVAARRDPDYAQKLHETTGALVSGAGRAAGDAAVMSAEIQRTAARLRILLDQTRGGLDHPR